MNWLRKPSQAVHTVSTVQSTPTHPYYPTWIDLPTYKANESNLTAIATQFAALWIAVLSLSWMLMTRYSRRLNIGDKLTVLWFILCGTLHMFFEGYFVWNREQLAGKQHLFAQLWKEYALCDSRYLTGDLVVLGAEAITVVVWGPLSYVVVVCILRRNHWRHPIQAVVSVGHIYGDTLYLSTSLMERFARDTSYSRPEALYFWFYFLFLNGIWLLVPGILLYQSSILITQALAGWQAVGSIYNGEDVDRLSAGIGHIKAG